MILTQPEQISASHLDLGDYVVFQNSTMRIARIVNLWNIDHPVRNFTFKDCAGVEHELIRYPANLPFPRVLAALEAVALQSQLLHSERSPRK